MPFVKLDCGIVDSTLWADRDRREIFITALLMAVPYEFTKPQEQIDVNAIRLTGFVAPPGWYGFVSAAGPGIVRRAGLDPEAGIEALEHLGSPDPGSRTPTFEGRRMIRIDGGYLILNYMNYRDKDYTAAERMRRLRQRKRDGVTRNGVDVTRKSDVADAKAYAKQSKKKTASALPDWLDGAAWTAWEIYRKELGKKLTQSTVTRQLKFLDSHRADHPAIIEQSIRAGWTGLFALKETPHGTEKPRNLSAVDRVRIATAKRDAELDAQDDVRDMASDDSHLRPQMGQRLRGNGRG